MNPQKKEACNHETRIVKNEKFIKRRKKPVIGPKEIRGRLIDERVIEKIPTAAVT